MNKQDRKPVLATIVGCWFIVSSVLSTALVELPASRKAGTWSSVSGIPTALICCSFCLEQPICFCVNYNKVEELCEIVTEDITRESDTTYEPAWTMYYILLKIADVSIKSIASASQSSLFPTLYAPAAQAIDGNYNTNIYAGSCMHTSTGPEEWWMVDFGKVYLITKIEIWMRSDCCSNVFQDMQILILENILDSPQLCDTFIGPPTATITTITCLNPIEGRFLKILRKHEPNAGFHFCEIDFF